MNLALRRHFLIQLPLIPILAKLTNGRLGDCRSSFDKLKLKPRTTFLAWIRAQLMQWIRCSPLVIGP
jgi:hypothetical protein